MSQLESRKRGCILAASRRKFSARLRTEKEKGAGKRVHYNDGFFWVEVAHAAGARVGDVPEGDTVILGHEVDVGHGEAGRADVKGCG